MAVIVTPSRQGRHYRAAITASLLLLSARAAGDTPADLSPSETATAATSTGPDTLMSMATLGIGLLVVLGLIFACAWLVRRMNGLSGMNSGAMKVVSVMALGTRERIALVDVGGTQILLGITPSTIRTLHVFDEPVVKPGDAGNSDFARRLQGMIGRQWKPEKAAAKPPGDAS
ncbi:flagellar biosynthetic protein FliO [Marinobacter caseinilyticus]|uniref:flagellar biosynthetic protein FliO n=1 Tax=Marinobacter caseinilyticus TaxID=2692195 RepID=UPI0014074A2C|nr:flagellar biosynthetic protein FliO [Marinobacter caseinilyticus]